MKVNVDGLFYCARVVGRIWREQKQNKLENFRAGSFIATASMSGHIANFPQLQTAYDASKAAVKHMCQNLVGQHDPRLLLHSDDLTIIGVGVGAVRKGQQHQPWVYCDGID
jgi:NAD(P)-dependent dehydrogenase (short-subunit alcohol dehydrogenase family)